MIWQPLKCVGKVALHFQLPLNTLEFLSGPTDKIYRPEVSTLLGRTSKSKCQWTYIHMNLFPCFVRENLSWSLSNHFRYTLHGTHIFNPSFLCIITAFNVRFCSSASRTIVNKMSLVINPVKWINKLQKLLIRYYATSNILTVFIMNNKVFWTWSRVLCKSVTNISQEPVGSIFRVEDPSKNW
jgi:hypothetical protein